jgi:hypothetical protein
MNFQPALRPRTLANVLLDLKEARDDWQEAIAAAEREEPDADDRATEAETRFDDLRDEMRVLFRCATGLTIEEMRDAYAEALL